MLHCKYDELRRIKKRVPAKEKCRVYGVSETCFRGIEFVKRIIIREARMFRTATRAQRYNTRMDKIFDGAMKSRFGSKFKVFNRDTGLLVGEFYNDALEHYGFKSDNYIIERI